MSNAAEFHGRWHGNRTCFGFHRDLHVEPIDTGIGSRCSREELEAAIRLSGADFVQTDSKGHPGFTSWFSRNPHASVGPGVEKDALAAWRAATRALGLPLHAHYSGIWDKAAGAKHPQWCIIGGDGQPVKAAWRGVKGDTGDKMCPRRGYAEELMIPQLLEMSATHGIDGIWVDGDIWAMEPCYCSACVAAYREKTGIEQPPRSPSEPGWAAWWNFTRESFEEYVARYCEAVHRQAPHVLVCSNWLHTFRHPGEPRIPTDWISGDNTAVWGMDSGRCEARFISTRGRPWDIMMWDFYFSHGWLGEQDWAPSVKPVQMLEQEAAVTVALGGNVQICDNPFAGLRQGQVASWRVRRVGEVARFVKKRHPLCRGTETIPQIAVLHSEHHARSRPIGGSPRDIDTAPVEGAVFSLLECSWGVDILDEWALAPRMAEFPLVVCPEQDRMSDAMVAALKTRVAGGGKLLVTGARALNRFGEEILGAQLDSVRENAVFHVPAARGAVAAWSTSWALVKPLTARALGVLGETPSLDEKLLPNPCAVVNRVGKGAVAWIPFDVFRDFHRNRYPLLREFIRTVTRSLGARFEVQVSAPSCVDVILRRKGARRIVHLVNRASGLPTLPNSGAIDEIPPVGPVTIVVRGPGVPRSARLAFETGALVVRRSGQGAQALVRITVPRVRIHAAVVLDRH
jgi:hypothetical protein